jgi:hypothetical protein
LIGEAEIALPTPNQNVPFVGGFPNGPCWGPWGHEAAGHKGPKGQALGVLTEYLWGLGVLIEYHGVPIALLGAHPGKTNKQKKQKHKKKNILLKKKTFFFGF